ncbi:MAG: hypothetical protein LQ342_001776 [Letrouitia transgressa]|nr:MAG: hypothetical protein LQ342_001776 [Letrouitia transgressa]
MCLCFRPSKSKTPPIGYYPSVPIERPLDVSDDGLSKAFQSLSIHSAPYPSAKTTVSTRSVAQPPSPPIKCAPSVTLSVVKPRSLPKRESPFSIISSVAKPPSPLVKSAPSVTLSVVEPPSLLKKESTSIISSVAKPPSPPIKNESTPSITPSAAEKRGQIPIFPMPSAPQCRRCHWIPKRREIVGISNPNGNAGRPYYICIKCKQYNNNNDSISSSTQLRRRERDGWITWDDDIGIRATNRPCYCGFVCRQGRAGVNSGYPGGGFWTCAIGKCNFLSFRRDAVPEWEARERGLPSDDGFEPWLL